MGPYSLRPENISSGAKWSVEWDTEVFTLSSTDVDPWLSIPVESAHRLIDHFSLFAEDKVIIAPPNRVSITFSADAEAIRAFQTLYEENLRRDDELRAELRSKARSAIPLGLASTLVGGGLFAAYCWLAFNGPDPPPGHWIRWFGSLIHLLLCFLFAMAFAGPFAVWFGLWQLRQLKRIEESSPSERTGLDSRFR